MTRLFNRPIFSETVPLLLGWSEEQLDPVVEVLSPDVPELRGKALKWPFRIQSALIRSRSCPE